MLFKNKALVVAMSALLLAACNDNNDDDNSAPTVQTATLIDAAVSGLSFDSGSQKGITDAEGKFKYILGETVTFKLGGLTLGTVKPSSAIVLLKSLNNGINAQSNLSLTTINRAVLLQTLDQDADSSNGIQLDTVTVDKLKNSTTLDFAIDTEQFKQQLTTLLTSLNISAPVIDAALAKNHLLISEAEVTGKAVETFSSGFISQIERHAVPDHYVTYTGNNPEIKSLFPKGFPLAIGSGLGFAGQSNGVATFYAITDRGPNADSPALTDGTATKVFPVSSFSPTLVKLSVDASGVKISDKKELNINGQKITGLPLSKGLVGSSNEVALSDLLSTNLGNDNNGLDTEAVALDPDGKHLWTCDEYGPFVVKIDIATGNIIEKFAPSSGLPSTIAKRQPNRGCEGLAYADNGKLYAIVQSTLDISKNSALFTRLVEFDPVAKTSKTFAYPIKPADWQDGKAGKAKLGDLLSLGNGRFVTIEQGTFADNKIHNKLYVFDIKNATDISNLKFGDAELEKIKDPAQLLDAGVITAQKTLLGDLKDYGWLMEKAEGLTLIDSNTLAISNDNDFGLRAEARDKDNKSVDPTELLVDSTGKITDEDGGTGYSYHILKGKPEERRTQLWYIKLANALK